MIKVTERVHQCDAMGTYRLVQTPVGEQAPIGVWCIKPKHGMREFVSTPRGMLYCPWCGMKLPKWGEEACEDW